MITPNEVEKVCESFSAKGWYVKDNEKGVWAPIKTPNSLGMDAHITFADEFAEPYVWFSVAGKADSSMSKAALTFLEKVAEYYRSQGINISYDASKHEIGMSTSSTLEGGKHIDPFQRCYNMISKLIEIAYQALVLSDRMSVSENVLGVDVLDPEHLVLFLAHEGSIH